MTIIDNDRLAYIVFTNNGLRTVLYFDEFLDRFEKCFKYNIG